jgi:hypothetical protein
MAGTSRRRSSIRPRSDPNRRATTLTILPDASGADRFEIFGTINNVLDKGEPKLLRLFGNGLYFDPVDRAFRIGVRAKR